jgi:hypothetical protein
VAYRRLPPGEGGFLYLFRQYQKSARRRRYSWNLSLERFREVVVGPCVFCGDERTQKAGKGRGLFWFTGIDRWANRVGYESGNVVACCGICNRMKSVLDGDDFLAIVTKIAANKAKS